MIWFQLTTLVNKVVDAVTAKPWVFVVLSSVDIVGMVKSTFVHHGAFNHIVTVVGIKDLPAPIAARQFASSTTHMVYFPLFRP